MLQRSGLSCEGHLALVPAVTRHASPSWYCGLLVRGKGSKTIDHSLKLASDQQEEEEARTLLPSRPDVQGVKEGRMQSYVGRRGCRRGCLQQHLQRSPFSSCHEESWASSPATWPSLQQCLFLCLAHGRPATKSELPFPGTSRMVQPPFFQGLGRENSLSPGLCCRKEMLPSGAQSHIRPLPGVSHAAWSNSLTSLHGRNRPRKL